MCLIGWSNDRSKAKNKILNTLDQPHVDNSYAVDDCIAAKDIRGVQIHLNKLADEVEIKPLVFNNGYLKIT